MNKVEAQSRILQNVALVQHQVSLLGANGQILGAYPETAIQDALNAVTPGKWSNLNAANNNFPVIDQISQGGDSGVQATLKATKAKFDTTIDGLKSELCSTRNRLGAVTELQVVGLTCVANSDVTSWSIISSSRQKVRVRGIALLSLLDFVNLDEEQLDRLDWAMQGLASINAFNLRSDEDEIATIVSYLDRPALRDRHLEGDWVGMQEAMRSIRRLLGQGVDDFTRLVARRYATFGPPFRSVLKEIYDDSAAISRLLRDEVALPGSLSPAEFTAVEGHRLRMQESTTKLANLARISPPAW